MQRVLVLCSALTLAACARAPNPDQAADQAPATAPSAAATPAAAAAATHAPMTAPAGHYVLDKAHGSLIFRVDHLGFSHFTARFKRFDAQLEFDPADLAHSSVTATVDATSIETDYPDPAQLDFNAMLQNDKWLDTAKYPQMMFRSAAIELTAPNAMRINGELTLHGVTRPVVLEATYNGGYEGHPLDPHARIGFSAHGTVRRSEFGIAFGIPEPGTTMGVSDEVDVTIEAEFSGPPLKASATPAG
jgi:polyisoprenoid-binding protein YceI